MPIDLSSLFATTVATLAAQESVVTDVPIALDRYVSSGETEIGAEAEAR